MIETTLVLLSLFMGLFGMWVGYKLGRSESQNLYRPPDGYADNQDKPVIHSKKDRTMWS